MKRWIYGVICSAVIMLIGASFTVAAETVTDPTGDVWHNSNSGAAGSWSGTTADKPDIDITQVSGTFDGNNLTVSITVAGTIQNSTGYSYHGYCNTTDGSFSFYWTNGAGGGMSAYNLEHTTAPMKTFKISGNTLRAIFVNYGASTTIVDLWASTTQYTQPPPGVYTVEGWGDWVPDSKIPFNTTQTGNQGNTPGENPGNTNNGNTTGGNNAGKKTPGFEMLPVIAAVTVAVIILRRRR